MKFNCLYNPSDVVQWKCNTGSMLGRAASHAKECEGVKELNYNAFDVFANVIIVMVDFNNLIAFVLIVAYVILF